MLKLRLLFLCTFLFFLWVEEIRFWERTLSTPYLAGCFFSQYLKCPWHKLSYFLGRFFPLEIVVGRIWPPALVTGFSKPFTQPCKKGHTPVPPTACHLWHHSNIISRTHSLANTISEVLKDFDPGSKITHISLPLHRKITVFVIFPHWQTSFLMKRYKFSTSSSKFLCKMLTYDLIFGSSRTREHFISMLAIQHDNQTRLFVRFQKGMSCWRKN